MSTPNVKLFTGSLQNFDTNNTISNGLYFARDDNHVVGLIFNNGKWYGADTLDLEWVESANTLKWYNFNPETKSYIPTEVDFNGIVENATEDLRDDVETIKAALGIGGTDILDTLQSLDDATKDNAQSIAELEARVDALEGNGGDVLLDFDGNPIEF